MNKDFIADYLDASSRVLNNLDHVALNEIVRVIVSLRERGGRLFILGVGGSAANAAHAVNDFRKLAHIETYAPTDNVSELTARVNDEGWETSFSNWLAGSRLNANDGIMVFSVGGGDAEKRVSVNLIRALEYAIANGAEVSNNSWGGPSPDQWMEALIEDGGQVGHVFVTAAGNEDSNNDIIPDYPGSYSSKNIINVMIYMFWDMGGIWELQIILQLT